MRSVVRVCCSRARCGAVVIAGVNGGVMGWIVVGVCGGET